MLAAQAEQEFEFDGRLVVEFDGLEVEDVRLDVYKRQLLTSMGCLFAVCFKWPDAAI